jgi:redox-sensitive bicupin YhaK (pirin superfamily)
VSDESSKDSTAPVELTIQPRVRSLGEFDVRRVLPAAQRRMVGPFVFLDHMGPAVFQPGSGINVRPHPHIGLATITYLFEGEIVHRDSLGYRQLIQAGAVNLMTAGRGIVHSERAATRARRDRAHVPPLPRRLAAGAGDRRLPRARDHRQRLRLALAGAHVLADVVRRGVDG